MNKKTITLAALAAVAVLVACNTSAGPTPNPTEGGSPTLEPGVVQGRAVDRNGKPIADALVWVLPAQTTGLARVRTNADGRYATKVSPRLPYYAIGWLETPYRGKTLCLRLAPEKPDGNDAFVPEKGVTRNFVWKVSGPIGRKGDGYFGGEVRAFFYGISVGDVIEYTFTPDGPLADGSPGRTITRTHDWDDFLWQDIPVGAYQVSAVRVEADGTRTPLKVSTKGQGVQMGDRALLEFKSGDGTCGGPGGNGLERAFIWVQTPDYKE